MQSHHHLRLPLPLPTWLVRYVDTPLSSPLSSFQQQVKMTNGALRVLSVFPGKTCQLANPCASNPCANGGQCSAFDSAYICTCPPAFHGQTCKQDVNECAQNPSPCLNGGVCVNEVGSYSCRCPQEYTGRHCETTYMPCSPSPCLNGGTCVQKGDTIYDCSCLPGNFTKRII